MPILKKPDEALTLIQNQVTLVDIREPEEFAADRIEGAKNIPLSLLMTFVPCLEGDILITCRSGKRTGEQNYPLFKKLTAGEIFILEGGMNAWNAEGLTKTPLI
ncbi:hypothetical protein FAI40_05990 [Acetobacteraceae bacterium]|nr:hypothetical protein FAI40_05990 [Acetobacteraceae bacterium]